MEKSVHYSPYYKYDKPNLDKPEPKRKIANKFVV